MRFCVVNLLRTYTELRCRSSIGVTSAHTLQQLFLTVNRLPSTNDHLNVISGFQTGHVVELMTNLSRFALQSIVIACPQTTARTGIKTILSPSSVGVSESPDSDTIYKSSELSDNNSPKLDSRVSPVGSCTSSVTWLPKQLP